MRVGSLFSGIGGLDLGLERAGMTVAWQSEVNPFACQVLAKHWPDTRNLGDITLIDWSEVEPVDVICGGYPCQPFSLAGVRQGEFDPRHLWPYFANAIRELRPRFALLENVPGHLSLGFGRVLGDLAELGFDADWECIPAAAFGAPHLRYRVFIVAYTHGEQLRQQPVAVGGSGVSTVAGIDGEKRSVAPDTNYEWGPVGRSVDPRYGQITRDAQWATEPDVGRVADGVPDRVDRLHALGNAVVPQVAEYVGRRMMEVNP